MKTTSSPIDRLLRTAAAQPNELPPEMPFGFDTRVMAQWRANWPGDPADIVRLLRRVVFLALALIILASAGAYRELSQRPGAGGPVGEEFAIADSAIGGVFDQ